MAAEWLSQREAAEILGVHVSLVPKMVRRGDLTPRQGTPSLSRDQSGSLRQRVPATAAEAKRRRTAAAGSAAAG